MSWFSGYRDEWKEIIETVAREYGRSNLLVEKDTIQSIFLSQLSKSDLPFVFKGGTSLSKAYNLIDRFSEDIDLSMSRKLTQSEKKDSKTQIINIAESIGLVLSNPDDVQSKYSYNLYVFKYDSLFSDRPMEMVVETSYYQNAYPTEQHDIGCFVGKFCKERNIALTIPFDAIDFTMNVQSKERTFIEKIFAVCDYRIQNNPDRESRHLYDICKLISFVKLDKELVKLIDIVRNDRMTSKSNPSAQLKYNIPEILDEIIQSRFYESDYKNITQKLLFEDVDYDYAVSNGILKVSKSDAFLYNAERAESTIK